MDRPDKVKEQLYTFTSLAIDLNMNERFDIIIAHIEQLEAEIVEHKKHVEFIEKLRLEDYRELLKLKGQL